MSSVSLCDENEATFDEMQDYLNTFRGGQVSLQKHEDIGVATICLEHRQKKNALTGKMMVDLRTHLLDLEQWSEGKAIILHGEGNFCSGGDLDFAMKSGNIQGARYISRWMQDTLMLLHNLPMISVCLLTGPSLGGGAEIAVYTDYLIASEDVSFGFVHGKLDIVPAYGGASRLIRKVGYEKGLDLLLTSKIIKANECLNIGLVEKVVPKETAYEDTFKWVSEKVKHHYTVTRALKQIALKASHDKLEEALAFERNMFCPFWGSERNQIALQKRMKHI